jgi:methylated-DNA-[protein]-cysteine S-methyltransferase
VSQDCKKNKTAGFIIHDSPVGSLYIAESEGFITQIQFMQRLISERHHLLREVGVVSDCEKPKNDIIVECCKQLNEYFAGERRVFDLPLRASGTEFQEKCWKALLTIPYGGTICYSELARRIDSPKAARAAGGANNKNPISIVIPCHRVIGKSGKLVGYGGGLDKKEFLLGLEKGKG